MTQRYILYIVFIEPACAYKLRVCIQRCRLSDVFMCVTAEGKQWGFENNYNIDGVCYFTALAPASIQYLGIIIWFAWSYSKHDIDLGRMASDLVVQE